jgi:curved DNA-binding protein CbpA
MALPGTAEVFVSDPLARLPPGLDPYKTLQVDPEADADVIQAAYRRLAQKFHPDVASGPDAASRMIAINAAWEVLGEPASRAAYDRRRVAAAGPSSPPTTASPRSGSPPGSPRSGPPPGASQPIEPRPPQAVSPDWTSGRSTHGSGYDPARMRTPEGSGAAGPPPGNPSGTVLGFGRYAGWSLGEIGRIDAEYLEWLDRAPIGRAYRDELDQLLRRLGRRRSARPGAGDESTRGLFRRR